MKNLIISLLFISTSFSVFPSEKNKDYIYEIVKNMINYQETITVETRMSELEKGGETEKLERLMEIYNSDFYNNSMEDYYLCVSNVIKKIVGEENSKPKSPQEAEATIINYGKEIKLNPELISCRIKSIDAIVANTFKNHKK